MDARRTAVPILLACALVACEGPYDAVTGPATVAPVAAYGVEPAWSGAPPVYQVAGGGSIVREDIESSPRETYGFHAALDATGTVKGQAEIHFPSSDLRMHIDVRCLVVRGREAWMSGPVTRSDRSDVYDGAVFVWRVEDNGERADAAPDRISDFLWRPDRNFHPNVCMRQPDLDTYPWDNGGATILSTGTALSQRALAGTWDATAFVYSNLSRPSQTQDAIAMGVRARLTVARDGRFSLVWWRPGTMFENIAGTMDVTNGHVVVTNYEEPDPATAEAGRFGATLWIDTDDAGSDFDGDGDEEPARLFAVFRLKKSGVLVNDLVGAWEARVFRYTKVADPSVVVDLLAQGVAFTFTVGADSRYTVTINGDEDTGEFIVEGDEFLTRNGESLSLTFRLEDDELTLEGPTDFDFPGAPDEPEAAVLELVMVRP